MPVPAHPNPRVPNPIYPFTKLSAVKYFSVARKAQYFTSAQIAADLGGCKPRQVSKNITRAIHQLVAIEALPPGAITEDIIQLYLRVHVPQLFGLPEDDDAADSPDDITAVLDLGNHHLLSPAHVITVPQGQLAQDSRVTVLAGPERQKPPHAHSRLQ